MTRRRTLRAGALLLALVAAATTPAAAAPSDPGPAAAAPSGAAAPESATAFRERVRTVLRDVGRIVAPEGIEEARTITLGGAPQWINIRGQDRRAPVLLFLHGGPGSPISSMAWTYQRPWEDFFTVVNWDQRGFGRSFGGAAEADRLKGTLNRERYIADTIELIERLRSEFHQDKIVLVGQSWGTVLALEVAKRRPDLLSAAVLQGLEVNWLKSPEMVREYELKEARAKGDEAEAKRLTELGPAPPASDPAAVLRWGARWGRPIPDAHTWHNIQGQGDGWARRTETLESISPDISAEEYEAQEARKRTQTAVLGARYGEAMSSVLPWDADRDVGVRFETPIIFMMGAWDWQANRDLARAYFERICAPVKKWDEFPNAAHALNVEQPGLSLMFLVTDVLPLTKGQVPPGADRCAAQTGAAGPSKRP